MSSIFGRLNFNFDDSKFGSSLYLTDETKSYLNTAPVELTTWQLNDIANGNIQMTDYYKNPVINVSNELKTNSNSLYTIANTIQVFDNVVDSANLLSSLANLIIEIENFKSHTNNVSGVTTATSTTNELGNDAVNYPDYDSAVNLGQQLLLLVNASDGVQNSTPLLGSMTSLFIGNELASNNTIIANDVITVNNSLRIETGNIVSNLTSSQVNVIISHVNTANTMLGTRREHDWYFYRTGLTIVDDYFKVEKLTRLGNTQTYLVNNLIGTDRYNNNLSGNT